jgi:dual specificity phosphatase 12
MRCSCGIWVCPAFSLQKGRVDEVIMKPAVEVEGGKAGNDENDVAEKMKGLGIRLPPGMRGADNGTKGNL